MGVKYRIGQHAKRRSGKVAFFAVSIPLCILGCGVAVIVRDLQNQPSTEVEGKARVVSQVLGNSEQKVTINEPLFTMQLPMGWHQIKRVNLLNEQSITWQNDISKPVADRTLTLYIDKMPQIPINRLLPITAQGNIVSYGTLSDNCATFTNGGTLNANEAPKLRPTTAKWQDVEFLCDLPRVIENTTGTGSAGESNGTLIVGETQGAHRYLFVYTDHDIHPDYSILYNAIRSFRAK